MNLLLQAGAPGGNFAESGSGVVVQTHPIFAVVLIIQEGVWKSKPLIFGGGAVL